MEITDGLLVKTSKHTSADAAGEKCAPPPVVRGPNAVHSSSFDKFSQVKLLNKQQQPADPKFWMAKQAHREGGKGGKFSRAPRHLGARRRSKILKRAFQVAYF